MGTWRRLAAIGGAAALLVGAGCGDDADKADDGKDITSDGESGQTGFAATPGYLQRVVDQSADTAYRFEMDANFSLGGAPIEIDGLATGEFDGIRQHLTMDMGAMFDGMMGQLGGGEELPEEMEGLLDGDMTIETVTDTDAMYMRAPFFSSMFGNVPADEVGEAGDLLNAFTSMGDGWGKVDLSELGDVLPGEAASALGGGQTYDPQVFLDMIKGSEGVEELGSDEIDGVSVNGLAADVSMAEMLEAQGMDGATAGAEGLEDMTFPIEVWIDGEDQIRRVSFTFDGESLADAAEEAGEDIDDMDIGSEMDAFEFGMTMDFTDYGDESIEVTVPSGDEVVDITEDFVEGYESLSELSVDADSLTES